MARLLLLLARLVSASCMVCVGDRLGGVGGGRVGRAPMDGGRDMADDGRHSAVQGGRGRKVWPRTQRTRRLRLRLRDRHKEKEWQTRIEHVGGYQEAHLENNGETKQGEPLWCAIARCGWGGGKKRAARLGRGCMKGGDEVCSVRNSSLVHETRR